MTATSIIIPCYNLGVFLPEAVESAKGQTRSASEIIIVDDGSTDPLTHEVLSRYSNEGMRVLYGENQGVAAARNRGIAAATGDYILCLDADDQLLPTFLEETVASLDAAPDAGIACPQVEFFGDSPGLWKPCEYSPTTLLWENCVPSASLFRRVCWEQAGGFVELKPYEDWNFWISVVERGWRWTVVPRVLYRYRQRAGSASKSDGVDRPALLRRIVEGHSEAYDAHWADVLVELDTELNRTRQRLRKFQRDTAIQSERIRNLRGALPKGDAPPAHTHRMFSVVICTYRREELVGKAIQSVFDQDYPKDCYELIVVNNDSPDRTEHVVKEYAGRSPVPFLYLVEKRNGVSHARNLGIANSRHEFVAFLDDDAVACTSWLGSFNRVINEERALVVGGRVEKAFDEGFAPPSWFDYLYVKGFFGINYRDWGKKEKVFRIRYPLYIGGGNSVYARNLFDQFGGFDVRLGRNGETLQAGEEAYLNLLLERHGVPIYYSDDAVIHHFIDTSRLTRLHLCRKAYWSGVSTALIDALAFGYRDARQKTRNHLIEARLRLIQILKSPRDAESFSRLCRVAHSIGYLAAFCRLRAKPAFRTDYRGTARTADSGAALDR